MKNQSLTITVLLFLISTLSQAQGDKVSFSTTGGFYDSVFSIALSTENSSYRIRYTTNGSEPTKYSMLYTDPLSLDEHLYSTSHIYTIQNCPKEQFRIPDSILHCIVVRAAVFDELDSCIGPTATNSYFIKALGCDLHGLPVVSLCVDSLALFDYEHGIFVPGGFFDPEKPKWTGNYYQRGEEWERLCNVEFYELDNRGINRLAGLRTHGGNGRRFQQKTMKLYARKRYGEKTFQHPFFENIPQTEFKHLILRPFHSSNTGIQDYLCSRLAQPLDVECLADRPCVLFINGEYWGIYFVKEKPDEHFIEEHYNIDARDVTVLSGWWGEAENGDGEFYKDFYRWMAHADLTDPKQYAHVDSCIDISNFIDYYILEMFIDNFDWPANNVRMWRTDGKFRWIFFDGDSGLWYEDIDVYSYVVYDGDKQYPTARVATLFFRKLKENHDFRKRFTQRFNQLMSSVFAYQNTRPLYNQIVSLLNDEVERQINRFGYPETWYPIDYNQWTKKYLTRVNNFLKNRTAHSFISLPKAEISAMESSNVGDNDIFIRLESATFGTEELQFFNLKGDKVFTQGCLLSEGNNTMTVHPDLPEGIYLLKIGNCIRKIIIFRLTNSQ